MSEPAKQFITAALNKLPSARPTVLQMLQHPWIRSFQVRNTLNDVTLSTPGWHQLYGLQVLSHPELVVR
jgi:hypothetical protein